MRESREAGASPIAALLQAPGIRLIPGTYTAAQLAEGDINELVTHPLFTGLDLLPLASRAAGATRVGARAAELAAAEGRAARPLSAVALRRLDGSGDLVPNRLGATGIALKRNTALGQWFETNFGRVNRDIMRQRNLFQSTAANELRGVSGLDDDLARTANSIYTAKTRYGIDDARDPVITEIALRGDPAEYSALPPHELAYVNDIRESVNQLGNRTVDFGELGKFVDDEGLSEFYPLNQYSALERSRAARDRADTRAALSREIISPSSDPNSYLTSALDAVRKPRPGPDVIGSGIPSSRRTLAMIEAGEQSIAETRFIVRANIKALDAAGFDVTDLSRAQTLAHKTGDWSKMEAALTRALENPLAQRPILPLADILTALRKYSRSDRLAYALTHAIQDGRWTRVTKILDAIQARYGPAAIPEFQDFTFVDSLRRHRDISRFLEHNIPDPYRAATRAADEFEKLYSSTPPARFNQVIKDRAQRAVTREAVEYAHARTPEAVRGITENVLRQAWRDLPEADWATIYHNALDDAANGWRDLRAAGQDPAFVHSVNPATAWTMEGANIGEVPTRVSQIKERSLDATPGIKSLHVAASGQAMELLSRRASEQFAQFVADIGTPLNQLRDGYRGAADQLMARNPALDYETAMQQVIAKDWTKFDPKQAGYQWGGPLLDHIDQQSIMLPNAVAKNLKMIHEPRSILGGVLDPVTKLFRMSVIGLSPRTQLYNVLGGAVMMAGETGPGAFKYAREAWDMVRNPQTIENATMKTLVGQQAKLFGELDDLGKTNRANQVAAYGYGKSLQRVWGEVQEAKATGKLKDAFGRVVNKSYEINGLVDDWYRAMAYLSGRDKALVKGMSKEVAEKAGIELTRKALMDWTSMTSMERSIMKSIFPFYGFMRHAIGYVMRYPMDHPLRAEIIAKLAMAELADGKEVLPTRFLGLLGIGSPDPKTGYQTFINAAPVNPFNDVANMVTLQGFLGATNPVINATLEAVGVERGEPELYPSLRYDPESGRLQATHPNPLLSLLSSTVPQTDLVTSLLGFNSQFRDTAQRDPAAAIRSLVSSAGLPIAWRNYNVPLEQMRAEVARQNAADEVQQQALKSGNWTNALRYPSLRDTFARVANLPPEISTLYRANTANPKSLAELVADTPMGPGTGAVDA